MIRMTHRVEENGGLSFSLCEHEFTLDDTSVESIGNVIFQAYQAGSIDMITCLGYRQDVVEEIFERRFNDVKFDFSPPMDLRLKALMEWACENEEDDDSLNS